MTTNEWQSYIQGSSFTQQSTFAVTYGIAGYQIMCTLIQPHAAGRISLYFLLYSVEHSPTRKK